MNLQDTLRSARIFVKKEKLRPLTTIWGEKLVPAKVRDEYPRPQMVRDDYTILNGYWDYTLVSSRKRTVLQKGRILVPFSPEASLSEAGFQLKPNQTLIYERALPADVRPDDDSRCILHFGAVDQLARVLINGRQAIAHLGGYLPFSVDITEYLKEEDNILQVQVEDVSDTSSRSVGKQRLKRGGMFYTAQSGIWQTVWLERVPAIHITDLRLTPHYDKETVHVAITLNRPLPVYHGCEPVTCHVIDQNGVVISKGTCTNHSDSLCEYTCYCDVDQMISWTPENPYLYHLKVCAGSDEVTGYFAMRQYSVELDEKHYPRFCLNHKPLFLTGVLDQGYWPDGLYTAPSDEALIYDIQSMKKLGFNMIRKHVKIECARWYYHCDRLGMIVWQDMVSGGKYSAPLMTWLPALFPAFKRKLNDHFYLLLGRKSQRGQEEFIRECRESVAALRCFPCISTWCIFNEGWGQFDTKKLTRLFRDMDPARLIDSASGWFDRRQGDFRSEHNYFARQFVAPDKRAFIISELGGYSCQVPGHTSSRSVYGYKLFPDEETFRRAYDKLMREEIEPLKNKGLCGIVYTQLSDIEEETNGLLTYDRKVCKL
ncbi:sugar-binding domain-containing protein [Roseburia hominis]